MVNHEEIKLKGGIYITVKELMLITGKTNYKSAHREHIAIRDAIAAKKRKLTIKEYCQYEGVEEKEITEVLNKSRQFFF